MDTLRSVTKYTNLADILRARILSNPDQGRLPSIRALMKRFKVSQTTVMSALQLLEEEELISRRHGSGVYRGAAKRSKVVAYLRPESLSTDLECKESSLLTACKARGWKLCVHRFDPERIDTFADEIEANAFVLQPETITFHSPLLARLTAQNIPRIILGRDTGGARLDFVTGDDAALIQELVKGLLDRGHRKIAFLVSEPHFFEIEQRMKSFREACDLLDLEDCPILDPGIEYGTSGYDASGKLLREFLAPIRGNSLPFTALISCSDSGSLPALRALHDAGFSVPADCSIACMGCNPQAQYYIPSMSNASQHYTELADACLRIIERRLDGDSSPLLFERIRYRAIWRESTGLAPAQTNRSQSKSSPDAVQAVRSGRGRRAVAV